MGPGEKIGAYRLERTLGRGAAGTTYEAERTGDGLRVALKVMRLAGASDWKMVELFEREARVLAHVTHPRVPAYVDHFTLDGPEGPVFCIAQELAQGPSLAERVAGGFRVDETAAKQMAEALLEVLDYLHGRMPPVIHRDIKPDNVILDGAGKIWLVDFGSVRDVYRTTAGGSTVAGTFGYMAPEQLRGVARPESDLHGVAATLLFVLTGRAPSDLPQRKLRIEFRPAVRVSPPFASWLAKMLEPAPEDRFPSAAAASFALRNPRAGRSSRAPAARGAAHPWRTGVLAGILGLLIVASGGVALHELREMTRVTFAGARKGLTDTNLPERPVGWRVPAVRMLKNIPAHFNPVSRASFTPDGSKVFSSSFDGTVKIWNAHTGDALGALAGHSGRVGAVQVLADGKTVVTAGDHTVRVWQMPEGKQLRAIDVGSPEVYSLSVAPDGRTLVAGGMGEARVFSVDGAPIARLAHGGKRVLSVAFAPDGSRVVTAGDEGFIKVWRAADWSLQRVLVGHQGSVSEAVVAPDGQLLASAGDDRTARLWHLDSGDLVRTLDLHTDEVWTVAFSPDDGTLLTGGKDGALAVWSLPTCELRQRLDLRSPIMRVDFAPDGVTFTTGHGGGSLLLWTLLKNGAHGPLPELHLVEPPLAAGAEARVYNDAMDQLGQWSGRGEILARAEAPLLALRARNPKSSLAAVGLAQIEMKRAYVRDDEYDPARLDRAATLAEEAVALDPSSTEAQMTHAWIQRAKKDPAGARVSVGRALAITPTLLGAQRLQARLAIDGGDLEGGEKTLRSILSKPISRALAFSTLGDLGEVYAGLGDADASEEARKRQIDLMPDSAWAKGNLAAFYVEEGKADAAITMAQQALAQMNYGMAKRTLVDGYCLKAEQALWERRDAAAARAALDDALRVGVPEGRIAYDLGALHTYLAATQGNPAELVEARTWMLRATQIDAKDDLAKRALARLGG